MNKHEAIERVNELTTTVALKGSGMQVLIDQQAVLEVIDQIHELDKVVVPKFVADWLEVCKENLGFSLSNAMSHSTSAMNKQPNWVKGWFNFKDNQEKFAKAWLYGYEVEKEKLYTVEIAGVSSSKMFKNIRTNKYLFHSGKGLKGYTDRLTEKEIKQADERLWQFAKEVEND